MVTTTVKPLTNQSDIGASTTVNQINDKKDTTSTLNNSSHSKIPVLNPTARSMKCASWAGNDLPITPDMNDLTPGKINNKSHKTLQCLVFAYFYIFFLVTISCASTFLLNLTAKGNILKQLSFISITGLRRRRQNMEKYVTDPSQLNLRFYRSKTRGIMR